MFSQNDIEFLRRHRMKILFAVAFLILGILFSTIGFFKTFFVLFLVILAVFVGGMVEDPDFLRKFIDKYFTR